MSDTIPTPRTDDLQRPATTFAPGDMVVASRFHADLERKLTAMTAQMDALRMEFDEYRLLLPSTPEDLQRAQQLRNGLVDDARSAKGMLASALKELLAAIKERDALREAGDNMMARVMGYYNTRATNQALSEWSKAKTK